MFKCIFFNENVWIPIEIWLKFVPKGSINNNPALFQIKAWCHPGDKPLSEPMMVSSLMHICVTGPQWVNNNQRLFSLNRSISQISQCVSPISHYTPFCNICVHICGIFFWCIVGFVRWVFSGKAEIMVITYWHFRAQLRETQIPIAMKNACVARMFSSSLQINWFLNTLRLD